MASTARAYSSESVMSETVVSSVESVTGTPARCSRASGCAATDGTIPACTFEVGHRSSVTPRSVSSAQSAGSSMRAGTVGDALRVHRERAAHLRRAAPFAGMEGDPQAAGPRGVEGARRAGRGSG